MYCSLAELQSGDFHLIRSMVTKESTLKCLEENIEKERNTHKITNYIPDFGVFWIDDEEHGMTYYQTTGGLLSIYELMLSWWGDNYDFTDMEVLDGSELLFA